MGCCMSTRTRSTAAKLSPNQNPQHPPNHHHRIHLPESVTSNVRTAPPPPLEEETVKEVLSETPILKPARTTTTTTHHAFEVEEEKKLEPKRPETMMASPPLEVIEVSEVSEMYSTMSESFSTNTMADSREDEVTSAQFGQWRQRVDRSPGGKRPFSGEISGGKERRVVRSPAKRSEPIQRTNIGSRTFRGRESGHVTEKRRNVGPARIRRDPGEISVRRSRSPVTRKEGVSTQNVAARGQTLKMTGRTSYRSPVPMTSDKSDDRHLTPEKESLENPSVSLECFIFL